jgi:transcriptional regulator with XRE-family HTH domain
VRITTNTTAKQPRSDIAAHVGCQLHKLRQLKQKTQREVADGAGLSTAFVCEIENGQSCPTVESLWKISKFFGVPIGFFVKGYEDD